LTLNIYGEDSGDDIDFEDASIQQSLQITAPINEPAVAQWHHFVLDGEFGGLLEEPYEYWFEIIADNASNPTVFFEQELVAANPDANLFYNDTNTTRADYELWDKLPLFSTLRRAGSGTSVESTTPRPTAIHSNKLYFLSGLEGDPDAGLYYIDMGEADTPTVADASGSVTNITGLCLWNDELFVSGEDITDKIDVSHSATDAGFDSRLLLNYKGYLWRVTEENEVSYSTDAADWFTVGSFYPLSAKAVSMAGMGDNVYIATQEGLFAVLPGDFIQWVVAWHERTSDDRGRFLTNVGGTLYVIVDNQTIYAIDDAHQITNILENNTLFLERGRVAHYMIRVKDYLCVAVRRGPSESPGSDIYLYKNGNWHFLTEVPATHYVEGMAWDASNSALAVFVQPSAIFKYDLSNLTTSFEYAENIRFAKNGWIEYDLFNGDKPTLDKEWESIIVDFRQNPYTNIELYGKYPIDAEGSNTYPANTWKKIYPEDGVELEYENNTKDEILEARITSDTEFGRRATRWMKLGIRLSSQHPDYTPVINAVALKYLPNVTDRWRWNLTIPVSDTQQLADGTLVPYTAAQQYAHLEALTQQGTLVYYRDLDGRLYGCKVLSAADDHQEYNPGIDTDEYADHVPYLYQITLQQFEEVAE
jgi:hypothetical protein